jgi:hypothetical protein
MYSINDESVAHSLPLSATATTPNYRLPDRVELHYDGLLALEPLLSNPGLVGQFAVRDRLGACGNISGASQRPMLPILVLVVLGLLGGIIAYQFYEGTQVAIGSPGKGQSRLESLGADRSLPKRSGPVKQGIDQPPIVDDINARPDGPFPPPVAGTPGKTVDIAVDALLPTASSNRPALSVAARPKEPQVEAMHELTVRPIQAVRSVATVAQPVSGRSHGCSSAVLALQLCGSAQ